MRSLFLCAAAAMLLAPTALQAQSASQRADLAAKLLAIVEKNAPPNSGTYSVAGTAQVGTQTKVYLRQERQKSAVNYEYLCTLLDGEAGWMCDRAAGSTGPIWVK